MRALTRTRELGGTWHGELSLAQLARWLLHAGQADADADGPDTVDPSPYLMDLPSPSGSISLVRPPGSPAWSAGREVVGQDHCTLATPVAVAGRSSVQKGSGDPVPVAVPL
jgi:hypothetical protein